MDNICEKLDRVADCLSEDKKLKYSYMVTIFIFIIEQFVSTFIKQEDVMNNVIDFIIEYWYIGLGLLALVLML